MGVNHTGQLPSVSVSFSLAKGVALGEAVAIHPNRDARINTTDDHDDPALKESTKVFQRERTKNLALLLFVAIGVVYIVLGALYEGYIHPLHGLSGLPSAGLNALDHALAVRQRAEHLLVCRPRHAHRHREEERDHADRLRARRRTPARHDADAGDSRRLPGPLPAHHDDDDGRAVRGAAARARFRRRRRLPAAARPRGRRAVSWVSQAITLYLTPVIYLYMSKLLKTRQNRRSDAGSVATA